MATAAQELVQDFDALLRNIAPLRSVSRIESAAALALRNLESARGRALDYDALANWSAPDG